MIEIYKDGVKMTTREQRRFIRESLLKHTALRMYCAGYDIDEIARVEGTAVHIIEAILNNQDESDKDNKN